MVRIRVRIWKPSTSASVQMITLFQRRLSRSKVAELLVGLGLNLHAAAQHLDEVGDDLVFENLVIVGLQAVEDFAAHRA